MRSALALLAFSALTGAGAHRAAPPPDPSRAGPLLVRVESVTPRPIFDGNQVETWRRIRFRIVGATGARWSEFGGAADRHVDVFDTRNIEGSDTIACPRSAPGEGIYVVQVSEVRGRGRLLDGVRHVLASCLPYDSGSAYGYALFDGER